jgi:hypothetical protein
VVVECSGSGAGGQSTSGQGTVSAPVPCPQGDVNDLAVTALVGMPCASEGQVCSGNGCTHCSVTCRCAVWEPSGVPLCPSTCG